MRPAVFVVALTFLALIVAGCVGPDPTPAGTDAPHYVTVDGTEYPVNQFLLGSPAPVHNTRVATGSEPAIWVDRDGQYIWIGDTTGVYRSADDGQTFQRRSPIQFNFLVADGWDITQDATGTLYAVGLAEARLHVYESTDKGSTWSAVHLPPDTAGVIPDRPWIAAHGDGNVALVYNDFPTLRTRCMISNDGGLTWPDQNPSGGTPIAGSAVFDGDTLYFTSGDGKVYRKDRAGATGTLGSPTQCALGGASWDATAWGMGHNNLIQVAAEDGKVFVTYSNGQGDMMLVGTDTFSGFPDPLVISPPALLTNVYGAIDVQDGRVVVAWYGSETDGNPTSSQFRGSWNVYVAVIDGFFTANPAIQHFRLTDAANHVGAICMSGTLCGTDRDLLDYFEVDIGPDGDIHVAYADDVRSRGNSYYARLANP